MNEDVWGILITMALILGIVFLFVYVGLPRAEVAECLKLEQQSKNYKMGWYATESEKEMCATYNIKL